LKPVKPQCAWILSSAKATTARGLQLFLPVGMYLQAGVKLTVDQGAPYRIPYTWCLTNACIAADLADSKMIKEMESGRTLVVEVVDSNILSVTTSLPLGQFASIRQGAPVQRSIRRSTNEFCLVELRRLGGRSLNRFDQ